MSKKKKRNIIIAIILLLCIAVTTTIVLVTRNPRRKQENQLADNGDIQTEEQIGDINAGHNNSEDVTLSSNIAEGKTELAEGKPSATQTSTEEAKKPTTESGSATDDNKPPGGTSDTTSKPNTTQTPTTQTQTPTTQIPTTQAPSTTEQTSGGNQGGGNGGNTHQHTWEAQYRTVHHDEVGHYENVCVKEAYDEPIYEGHYVCNYCGIDITATGVGLGHCLVCGPPYPPDHPLYGQFETQGSSYGTVLVQVSTTHHDAVYEKKWIVDKKAYDEQVPNGYKCTTCGATK